MLTGADCASLSFETFTIDNNANGVLDAGDDFDVTLVAGGGPTPATLTELSLQLSIPSGTGTTVVGNVIDIDGVAATAAVDGDNAALVGETVQATVSALPARLHVRMRLGSYIAPAVLSPVVSSRGTLLATDIDNHFQISESSTGVAFTQPIADLVVTTKTFDSPEPGAYARYSATVTNTGPSPSPSAVVTVPIPVAIIDLVDAPATCTTTADLLSCPVGALGVGEAATVAFRLRARAGAALGSSYELKITAVGPVHDPALTSNTVTINEVIGSVADLAVTHAGPVTGFSGGVVNFSATVTNNGPNRATNVIMIETVPAQLRAFTLAAGSTNECQIVPGPPAATATCPLGELPSGASVTVLFTGRLAPETPAGSLTLSAAASTASFDKILTNNSAAAILTVGQAVDLSVTEAPAATTVFAGGKWSSVVTVNNAGPSIAQSVVVTSDYGALLSGAKATVADGTCTVATPLVTCTIASMNAGAKVDITVTGTVSPALASGSAPIVVTTTVSSSTQESAAPNNIATTAVTIASNSDVSVTVSGRGTILVGESVTYTVVYKNAGPSDSAGVSLSVTGTTDLLDLAVISDAAACSVTSPNRITCGRIRLAAGGSATVTVTGRTSKDLAAGAKVGVEARVVGDSPDESEANNVASFNSEANLAPELAISMSDLGTVTAGSRASYTITVSNTGATRSDGVSLSVIGSDLFEGFQVSGLGCFGQRCDFGRLDAGAKVTVTASGSIGSFVTDGFVSVDATATALEGKSAQTRTTTAIVVENRIRSTVDASVQVIAGQSFRLDYQVTNAGPSDATDVTVTISVPTQLTVTTDGGCALDRSVIGGSQLTCSAGRLTQDDTRTFSILFASDPNMERSTSIAFGVSWRPRADSGDQGQTAVLVTRAARVVISTNVPSTATAGDTTLGTMSIRNNGPSTARDVEFVVSVADGSSRPTVASNGGPCARRIGRVFVCRVPLLAPEQLVDVTLSIPVGRDVADGTQLPYSMVVSSSTPSTDAPLVEEGFVASTPLLVDERVAGVIAVRSIADLRTSINAPDNVKAGAAFPIEVRVVNAGFSTARDVKVVIDTPIREFSSESVKANGVDCALDANSQLLCRVGTLPPGAQTTMHIDGIVHADRADQTPLPVSAIATSTTGEADDANNAGNIRRFTLGETSDPIEQKRIDDYNRVGNSVVLQGEIDNPTTTTIGNVVVVQDIPEGQRVLAAAITSGDCATAARQVLCWVGDVEPDAKVRVRVTTVVDRPTNRSTALSMSAYSADPSYESMADFTETDEGFDRPVVAGVSGLAVTYSPYVFKPSTSAQGPLLAAAMLVFVFALGMVGWIRKGRRDPLDILPV